MVGVGGKIAGTTWRLEDLAAVIDEFLDSVADPGADEGLVASLSRLRRERRRLDLRLWKTAAEFCRS